MTEDKFKSYCFKHCMPMDYTHPRSGHRFICIVTAVDFDNGLIKMWPCENDLFEYDKKEFWCHYDYVDKPLPTLKAIT